MTKTKQLHAKHIKPYAVFCRTGRQIEKFHFINGWGHLLLTILVHMEATKDYTNLKSMAMDIVDDSIQGWLTFAEVDCYLRDIRILRKCEGWLT